MRHFSPLALIALSAIPLSAHDHWRDPRCVLNRHWEGRREERWVGHDHVRRHDLDDRVILRSLDPPFRRQVELRFR